MQDDRTSGRAWGSMLLAAVAGAALALGVQALLRGAARDVPPAADDARRPGAPETPAPSEVGRAAPDLDASPPAPPAPTDAATPLGSGTWSAEEVEFARAAILEERRRRDAARIRDTDGGLDVLDRVFQERADPSPLLAQPTVFAAHVRPAEGPAARLAATAGAAATRVGDAEVGGTRILEFGAGTFQVDARGWSDVRADVAAIEIRGAGMDATTLVLERDLLFILADVAHLRIRDLTIDGGSRGASVLDLRGRAAAVFERVRFRSWWPSAGHGSPLGVSGQAYLALLDCVVEGGVGKPAGGKVVSLRGPALVVARGCRFSDVECVVIGNPVARGSRVRLEGCTFQSAPLADSRIRGGRGEAPFIDVRVIGGAVEHLDAEEDDAARRRAWGAEFAAEVRDVSFGPDPSIPTLGDLLAVLESFEVPAGQRVVEVDVESRGRGERPPAFAVFTWGGEGAGTTRWRVVGTGRGAAASRNDVGGGTALPAAAAVGRALALEEALRRSGLPLATAAAHIVYGPPAAGGTAATIHVMRPDRAGFAAILDGEDGRVASPAR